MLLREMESMGPSDSESGEGTRSEGEKLKERKRRSWTRIVEERLNIPPEERKKDRRLLRPGLSHDGISSGSNRFLSAVWLSRVLDGIAISLNTSAALQKRWPTVQLSLLCIARSQRRALERTTGEEVNVCDVVRTVMSPKTISLCRRS